MACEAMRARFKFGGCHPTEGYTESDSAHCAQSEYRQRTLTLQAGLLLVKIVSAPLSAGCEKRLRAGSSVGTISPV